MAWPTFRPGSNVLLKEADAVNQISLVKWMPGSHEPFPFGNHEFIFYACESVSVLQISSFFTSIIFLHSVYKQYHVIFVFLNLTSFSSDST